ncbi:MAG: serine/threonine protein kinase [Deltaproteobacteria bacterium]
MELDLLGVVARGGHGSVFLAWDESQGRPLAFKVIEAAVGAGARVLGGLRAFPSDEPEPPVLAYLDHGGEAQAPEGVRRALRELGPSKGDRIWIVMPYVDGPSARELLLGDAGFGLAETVALLRQLAQRLRRLHPGRAHLDLKPENVLIDRAGRAFLVDPQLLTDRGTAGYAAPEQRVEGGRPGPPADVYALCVIGLALLSRELPSATGRGGPRVPEAPAALPPAARNGWSDLTSLLVRGFSQDPAGRPSAVELERALADLAERSLAQAPEAVLAAAVARARLPEELEERARLIASRRSGLERQRFPAPPLLPTAAAPRRAPLLAAGLLAAALLAVGGLGLWRLRHPPRPPAVLPLAVDELIPEGYGAFQLNVTRPEKVVRVKRYGGDVVWELKSPTLGSSVKIGLLPDDYLYEQIPLDPKLAPQEIDCSIGAAGESIKWDTPIDPLVNDPAAGG